MKKSLLILAIFFVAISCSKEKDSEKDGKKVNNSDAKNDNMPASVRDSTARYINIPVNIDSVIRMNTKPKVNSKMGPVPSLAASYTDISGKIHINVYYHISGPPTNHPVATCLLGDADYAMIGGALVQQHGIAVVGI